MKVLTSLNGGSELHSAVLVLHYVSAFPIQNCWRASARKGGCSVVKTKKKSSKRIYTLASRKSPDDDTHLSSELLAELLAEQPAASASVLLETLLVESRKVVEEFPQDGSR